MTSASNSQRQEEKPTICICGLAGSGKSTAAKRIAKHYRLRYYSGGDALKAVAADLGYITTGKDWWETDRGISFLEQRLENLDLDMKVDQKLLEWARQGKVVLDSWTMPWLLKEGFKIWLEAAPEERARRVAKRDNLKIEEASLLLKERESRTKAIYKELYGFNLGEDFEPFDLIVDVNRLNKNEVFQTICIALDNTFFKK